MFVGESPSAGAELYGRPFPVAPAKTSIPFAPESGDVLRRWLERLGLHLEWVYFTNLVKCRKQGAELGWDEIKACESYLETEIELIKPKLVVALGAHAVRKWFSTPTRVARISEVRGKSVEIDGITYFPLWHPSMIARGGIGINIEGDLSSLSQVVDTLF
jgi:DNA polymerase